MTLTTFIIRMILYFMCGWVTLFSHDALLGLIGWLIAMCYCGIAYIKQTKDN